MTQDEAVRTSAVHLLFMAAGFIAGVVTTTGKTRQGILETAEQMTSVAQKLAAMPLAPTVLAYSATRPTPEPGPQGEDEDWDDEPDDSSIPN